MTKYAYRLPPCAPYDIPAMQLWLERMAARGLHLAQDGFFCGIASFEIGTPRNEKFRLEATTTNGGLLSEEYSPEEEALQLCRQMGWTYRARRGQFHIYSSADPNAPELHTDPRIQAMTIGVLGKHLNREMVNSLILLVFYALFYFGNLIVSAAVTIGSWWVALVLALILWSLGRKLSGILTLRRIRRQLLNDQAIQPTGRVRWQYPISRICALGLTILTAGHFLILAGQHLTEEDAVALSEYTAPLPFATLSDLYPGSETAPNTGFLDSQVIVWSDFLSPENYDYSEYSQITWEGRSFDAYLTVQFHRTRWAWVADRLAGEFLSQAGGSLLNQTADRIFGQEPVTETELDLPGADYCAYYYSDLHDPYIILRQGEIVLHIRLSPLGDGVALEPEEIAQAFLAQIR